MDRKKVEKKVKEILASRLSIPEEKITLNSHLVDDLGMDSFLAVEISFEIRDTIDVDISENELTTIKRVRDIVELVYVKQRST
jgi:acyl carrier protein